MDIPIICFTIFYEIIYSSFLYGQWSRSSSFGESVASDKEARESIIMLIQSNDIGYKGDSCRMHDPIKADIRATILTVN